MTNEQFIHEMKMLLDVFGSAEYPSVRMKLIYEQVADLSPNMLAAIVKHFCQSRSVKHPPFANHFIEEANNMRKRAKERPINDIVEDFHDDRSPERLVKVLDLFGANSMDEALNKVIEQQKNQEGK